ncbi:MAG: hypothetical protein ACUVTL_00350 [Thermoproteota archaeon]
MFYDKLKAKYETFSDVNRYQFEGALKNHIKGQKLNVRHWKGGYVFAASREWRIKTIEQFSVALRVEEEHFTSALEEIHRVAEEQRSWGMG